MDYMTMNFNRNGGGGGTSDYSQLSNKPKINGVTLVGNKTSADLGLMPEYEVDNTPTEDSENLITSGAVYEADKNINDKLQGSKQASSTSGTIEIPDYGMTESIDMYFKPKQDLHGYDKPWAGGAGKNKFNPANYAENSFDGTTYTDVAGDGDISQQITLPAGTYIFSVKLLSLPSAERTLVFTPTLYGDNLWSLSHLEVKDVGEVYQGTVTIENKTSFYAYLYGTGGGTFKIQIQIESGNQATDFEPYSNICPISGQDNATFSWTDDEDIETEVSMNFGNTYYGGFCQFNGQIYSEWDYISGSSVSDLTSLGATTGTTGAGLLYIAMSGVSVAVDNGSVATSDQLVCNNLENVDAIANWNTNISGVCLNSANNLTLAVKDITTQADMDTWLSNNPIQIAYKKKTPTYAKVTPPANLNLTDDYPIEYNGYMASISYQPKNTVLAEAKKYTNQEIAKLGFPKPPTTDGTYHLECSVSSGTPTIRWVLNS